MSGGILRALVPQTGARFRVDAMLTKSNSRVFPRTRSCFGSAFYVCILGHFGAIFVKAFRTLTDSRYTGVFARGF